MPAGLRALGATGPTSRIYSVTALTITSKELKDQTPMIPRAVACQNGVSHNRYISSDTGA